MANVYKSIPSDPFLGQSLFTLDPNDFLFSHLRLAGNPLASRELAVDASSAAVKFSYKVPTGRVARIHRIMIVILDKPITPTNFGGISALTNGLKFDVINKDGVSTVFDFLDGVTIKRNADFGCLAGVDVQIDAGGAADMLLVRWTISDVGANCFLTEDQSFQITVQDDLTGLDSASVMIQGWTANG